MLPRPQKRLEPSKDLDESSLAQTVTNSVCFGKLLVVKKVLLVVVLGLHGDSSVNVNKCSSPQRMTPRAGRPTAIDALLACPLSYCKHFLLRS